MPAVAMAGMLAKCHSVRHLLLLSAPPKLSGHFLRISAVVTRFAASLLPATSYELM